MKCRLPILVALLAMATASPVNNQRRQDMETSPIAVTDPPPSTDATEPPAPTTTDLAVATESQVPTDSGVTTDAPSTNGAPDATESSAAAPSTESSSTAPPTSDVPVASNTATPLAVAQGPYVSRPSGEYLYVWAGADGRQAADRLITLDFNPSSPTYGRVVSQTIIPEPNASGNEPHHCGLSADGQTLICGGLLSLLKSQDEVFVFSLANPAFPALIATTKGKDGSVPDDFYPLPDNTFILTQMGSNTGGTPGRVVKLNTDGNIISEHPSVIPSGFNPHGIDVRADLNLMITCDYVDPSSTLNTSPGDVVMRSSVRIWALDAMEIVHTINLPPGTGTMDCKLLKRNPRGMGFVGGSGNGKIYLWDSFTGQATNVINLNNDIVFFLARPFTPKVLSQYMQVSADDQRLYIPYATNTGNIFLDSGLYSGIAVYDISNPTRPRFLQNKAMPSGAGPHLSHIMGNRLIVTDYFLDEDDFGKVHLNGDHHVRSYVFDSQGRLQTDYRFDVDFDNIIWGLKLRPHGVASNMR